MLGGDKTARSPDHDPISALAPDWAPSEGKTDLTYQQDPSGGRP